MPRNRLPVLKAEASGAAVVNPARFKDRKAPKKMRPLGEPYARMSEPEKAAWAEFKADMPWLHSGHRVLVRLACYWTAKLDDPDSGFSTSATTSLGVILSKMGATPVDETRVNHADGDEEDPADRFFARPN